METIVGLEKNEALNDFAQSRFRERLLKPESTRINPVLEIIRAEGGEDFYQYLQLLQLAKKRIYLHSRPRTIITMI